MENLTQPTLLLKPFAENGQRNSIPENATGTNLASLDEGFPPVTGQNPRDGGIPPTRLDFNGLGYLTTTYDYFYQAGGCFTFNQVVSDAIGGYPLNARLWYLNANGESSVLRSTKNNNTDNFLTDPSVIGDSWVYDVATTTYVKDEINEIRTNCITEIPQDIKLELNNGTLTLKAGSKVYVPNGSGVFDEVTVASDNNVSTAGGATKIMLFYNRTNGAVWFAELAYQNSGTTPSGDGFYYNTSTNKLVFLRSGVADPYEFSFPIGIVTSDSTKYTEINQVFNGFGYIGSTVFALPGVKGLIPNGRNEDGTLRNIERTLSTVITRNMGGSGVFFLGASLVSGFDYVPLSQYNASDTTTPSGVRRWYNPDTNYLYWIESGVITRGNVLYVGNISLNNGRITSLQPRNTFHAVDYFDAVKYSDKTEVVGWGMPDYSAVISVGYSYTAPSNGFISIRTQGNGNYFSGSIGSLSISTGGNFSNYHEADTSLFPIKKGDTLSGSGSADIHFIPAVGG